MLINFFSHSVEKLLGTSGVPKMHAHSSHINGRPHNKFN